MNKMRCMNKLVTKTTHRRCCLDHEHEGVCRTRDGKPFTPNITYDDRLAQKMEDSLVPPEDKPVYQPLRTFRNNTLALKLAPHLSQVRRR